MNENQQKIMHGIATSSSIDGNECQTIIAAAINVGIGTGGMSPPQAVVILESIKWGILKKIHEPKVIIEPSGIIPDGGGR